jgi:nitric oxide reductase subunit C
VKLMSERMLRSIFVVGTVLFLLILGAMTVDSLSQVASARTAQLTDQVVAGKQVWQSKNCNDCHTILGIGGYYAPELTKTFNRRGGAWLRAFLKDPQKVLPGTTMQNQNLSDQQAGNLVAFFQWVSLVDTNNWPPQPLGAQPVANPPPTNPPPAQPATAASPVPAATAAPTNTPSLSGSAVYQDKGCYVCHTINGQGGQAGPNLSHIATQPYDGLANTPEFIAKYLENPQAQKADALMPAIPMSTAERDALVQYLMSLK